jgi:hypothetical protein
MTEFTWYGNILNRDNHFLIYSTPLNSMFVLMTVIKKYSFDFIASIIDPCGS